MCGEGDASTTAPPSKHQTCSREYWRLRKSGPVFCQRMVAVCDDMGEAVYAAIFAASRTASTKLLPVARPCQAMSQAVP